MIVKPAVIGVPVVPSPDVPRITNDNGGVVPPWLMPTVPNPPKK